MIPNTKLNKVLKTLIAPKNESLPDSRGFNYMSYSSNLTTGQLISFQAKQKAVDDISKDFDKTHYFPDDETVPDGFKINGNLYLVGNMKNQVTVIDRKKDKDLQEIFQAYQSQIPEWQKEFERISKRPLSVQEQFAIEEGKMQKLDWQTFLISNTKSFIVSYSRFPVAKSMKILEKLAGKETYMGEILKSGLGVCRHEAFLFKLLMETQGIPVACQAGFRMDTGEPYDEMFQGHLWNVIKKGNAQHIEDIADRRSDKRQYLDTNFDYLYFDKSKPLSLEEKFKQDILDMQPGQNLQIGLDKDNNLVTEKTNPNADFGLKLIWNEEDKFELHKLKESVGQRSITYNNYPDNKINTLKDRIYIWYGNENFSIYPNDIRANFNRQVEKTFFQLWHKYNFKITSFFIEDFVKTKPDLDPKALEIFHDFKDIGVNIRENR
ncbi:MAG: hypothetical protein PHC34_01320 [Candidatus Gastranaerophilales bacterium]|nr:hypothetical protein [Candidatus Gastranaerophilales bacterium]